MFISSKKSSIRGWTLTEMVVAVAIFSIAGLALSTIFSFSIRGMVAISNYSELDSQNRFAMDRLTKEIREAKQVTAYSTNSVTIVDGNGYNVSYTFSPAARTMVRSSSDGTSQMLLTNCSLLSFSLFQRNPPMPGYTDPLILDATNSNWQLMVKGIQLTWKTSRTVPGTPIVNSENVQTARIVIRKQQD
jgi:prepilin-type N-terminal cleavage/methylation domain-containing protein